MSIVSTIPQLTKIWTTTTNTCKMCRKSCDENHEHGPNKASGDSACRKSVVSSMQACVQSWAFPSTNCHCSVPCLQTRVRCEPSHKFTHQICAIHRFPQRCVIMAFANSCCQYITSWTCPLNISCAMTVSLAIDSSTGAGQHNYTKRRLAFAYAA